MPTKKQEDTITGVEPIVRVPRAKGLWGQVPPSEHDKLTAAQQGRTTAGKAKKGEQKHERLLDEIAVAEAED